MSGFIHLNFKTGLRPSALRKFDMENLTNTQKLILVRNRIFGTTVNSNYRTGAKKLKANVQYWREAHYKWVHASEIFPWLKEVDKIRYAKKMFEQRRLRIVMRGVKIGQKRGSAVGKASNTIFDTKK